MPVEDDLPGAGLDDIARWDAVADAYAAATGPAGDSFFRRLQPFLARELPDVAGRRVLDLGCGHGWLAGILAAGGAEVVGIDGSSALLGRARVDHPDVRFVRADLTAGLPDGLGSFDVVLSHMVLMDLPELDRLVADVAGSLAPAGVFLASILHPAYFSHAVDEPGEEGVGDGPGDVRSWRRHVSGYLDHEERWVGAFGGHRHYHRPLSWYVDVLSRNGLAVTALDEPPSLPQDDRPQEQWSAYERWFSRIPTMLAWAARRT